MVIINGFLLGLSTGIFCLLWCGPIFVPLVLTEDGKTRKSFSLFLKFISGRLIGYILFGALIGYLGLKIENETIRKINLGALIILASLLILYGFGLLKEKKIFCGFFKKIKFPILAGFLTGINVCPSFLLALTYIFDIGGAVKGILFFIGFFAATSLYVFPLIFLKVLKTQVISHKIAEIVAILSGLIFLIYGLKNFFSPPSCQNCPLAGQIQASNWLPLIILSAILLTACLSRLGKGRLNFLRKNSGGLRNFALLFSLIYFGFFLKNIFCPLLTFQMLFILGGKIAAGLVAFLFFLLPILTALIIGKIYCHWACPLGAFQEFLSKIARFLKLPQIKIHYPKFKYLVFVLIALSLLILRKPILCGIDPFGALFGRFVTPVSIALLVILIGASLVIFRPWCRFFCPYGVVLNLLSKFSLLKNKK